MKTKPSVPSRPAPALRVHVPGGPTISAPRAMVSVPAVYRPHAAVQPKANVAAKVVVPPVYRPQPIVQPKLRAAAPVVPPAYWPPVAQAKRVSAARPSLPQPAVVQMVRVKKPAGVKLTGGNGVSVVWKKSSKSDLPHVSVGHGAADKDGMINVTNFHYKWAHASYFMWDEKSGQATFAFRGGEPSAKIFALTQKAASKFGITLDKPQSVRDEEAAAAVAAAAVAAAAKAKPAAAATPAWSAEDEEAAFEAASAAKAAAPASAASAASGAWDDEW